MNPVFDILRKAIARSIIIGAVVFGVILVPAPQALAQSSGSGSVLPATCNTGDIFYISTVPRGWYDCTATNMWKAPGGNQILLGAAKSVNINSAGTDTTAAIGATKYAVRRVVVTNASTSLGLSLATIGVYTGAGASGSTVVAPAVLTTLSSSSKYVDMSIALSSDTLASTPLYIRNVIAHGSAATVDVYVFGDSLP